MTHFDRFIFEIKMHLKNNFWVYFFVVLAIVFGIGLGFFIVFSSSTYENILSPVDKNLFEYINGSVNISSLFFSKILNSILFLLIIFLTTLTIYTSFIAVLVIGYQCMLLVVSCGAIISLYGVSGVVNSLLLIIPINLANLIVMAFFCGVSISRAHVARRFNMDYKSSCSYTKYGGLLLSCFIMSVFVCIVHTIIIPLLVKSLIVISF